MNITIIAEAGQELRIREDDAVYSRPFRTHDGRLMMSVEYDAGDRFVFYTNEDDPIVQAFREAGL